MPSGFEQVKRKLARPGARLLVCAVVLVAPLVLPWDWSSLTFVWSHAGFFWPYLLLTAAASFLLGIRLGPGQLIPLRRRAGWALVGCSGWFLGAVVFTSPLSLSMPTLMWWIVPALSVLALGCRLRAEGRVPTLARQLIAVGALGVLAWLLAPLGLLGNSVLIVDVFRMATAAAGSGAAGVPFIVLALYFALLAGITVACLLSTGTKYSKIVVGIGATFCLWFASGALVVYAVLQTLTGDFFGIAPVIYVAGQIGAVQYAAHDSGFALANR